MSESKQSGSDLFHLHLDICKQCRENPFNLCDSGYLLIRSAVHGIDEVFKGHVPGESAVSKPSPLMLAGLEMGQTPEEVERIRKVAVDVFGPGIAALL